MPKVVGRVVSKPVYPKSRPTDRFWMQVDKNGPIHPIVGQCWLWTGSKHKGYGRLKIRGRQILAHRFSWELHNRQRIPDNLQILHSCDNPACVRPEHLSVGTTLDNSVDAQQKGRLPVGEQQYAAKLTEQQVIEIRSRSTENKSALSREFGISRTQLGRIIAGQKWRHVAGGQV